MSGPGGDEPPLVDVLLEVEDPEADNGIALISAHRVILGACSHVFRQLLRKLPEGEALRLDPVCCRSVEVTMVALRFLYTGNVVCNFATNGFLLWQLLCLCTHYKLPELLTTYTRTALLHALGDSRYAPVIPFLLQAREKVGLKREDVFFVSVVFLSSSEALDCTSNDPQRQATILSSALSIVENPLLRS